MGLNYALIQQKVLRLIKRRKTFQDASNKQWEICPPETTLAPSAIFLDGMLDRVKNVAIWTSFEFECKRVLGGNRDHGGTTAYNLSDVRLINGNLYKGEMRYAVSPEPETYWIGDRIEHLSHAQLASTYFGSRFFGHWMREEVPLMMLAGHFGEVVRIERKPHYHEPGYQAIFNVSSRSVKCAKFDDLIVLDDIGQNSFKRKRYEQLRAAVKAVESIQEPPPGVFIRRGKTGVTRQVTNIDEVEAFFTHLGFTVLEPETMTPLEIVQQIKGTKMVATVEGSNLVHAYNSIADDGTILVIQPPHRFSNATKDYTDCVGLNYAFLVAHEGANPSEFSVDIAELERTLEKIDRLTP